VTHLRKMMLEELQRRNYAKTTIDCYIRAVEDFSRHFHCSPDRLGPRHIREYQAELFQKREFSPNTVAQRLAALRFFYVKTLKNDRAEVLVQEKYESFISQPWAAKLSLVEPGGYRPPAPAAYSPAPSAVSWCCIPPPLLDHDLRLLQRVKDLSIQALVS
jgi:hypothetical protein